MASLTRGSTVRQVEHQEAVQRVRRGLLDDVDRERYVWKEAELRTLQHPHELITSRDKVVICRVSPNLRIEYLVLGSSVGRRGEVLRY